MQSQRRLASSQAWNACRTRFSTIYWTSRNGRRDQSSQQHIYLLIIIYNSIFFSLFLCHLLLSNVEICILRSPLDTKSSDPLRRFPKVVATDHFSELNFGNKGCASRRGERMLRNMTQQLPEDTDAARSQLCGGREGVPNAKSAIDAAVSILISGISSGGSPTCWRASKSGIPRP